MCVSISNVNKLGVIEDPKQIPSDMKNPVKPEYSKRQIVDAGKVLKQRLALGVQYKSYGLSLNDSFKIAHNWRDAHSYPMWRSRLELASKSKQVDSNSITASRLKRMNSIRRKLQRPFTLYQLQDIAGCRAIVADIDCVKLLADRYSQGDCLHNIAGEDNYLLNPKADGYRGRHIVLKFNGNDDKQIFNRQNIELQIRSRLQHSWATAVEAVGLVQGMDIKGGAGSSDWRRFFALMSSEFAEIENSPLVPGADQNSSERHNEIKALSRKLKAVKTLESFKNAVKGSESYYWGGNERYYLLQYDYENQQLEVRPYFDFPESSRNYAIEERKFKGRNTVLIEVDKVENLKQAYPNYFLDVQMFTDKLREVLSPSSRGRKFYDLSWLKGWR